VCNYIRMTKLISQESLLKDPSILLDLTKISEHHSRLLLQIADEEKRCALLKAIVLDHLSVRELGRIIASFRGWLKQTKIHNECLVQSNFVNNQKTCQDENFGLDKLEILNAIIGEFTLPREGDFHKYCDLHALDQDFSVFSIFFQGPIKIGADAVKIEEEWFYSIAPFLFAKLRDIHIQIFGAVALATCCVDIQAQSSLPLQSGSYRGTVFLVKRRYHWRILHEHWSVMSNFLNENESFPGKTALLSNPESRS
jgi:hypothetical protein